MKNLEMDFGPRIDYEVLARVPEEYQSIVSGELEVVKRAQELFNAQIVEGYYPPGIAARKVIIAARQDKSLLDPHVLVRKRGRQGRLKAVPYHQEEPFRSKIQEISPMIRQVIAEADTSGLPDRYLIRLLLEPQARSFEEGGDFEQSMSAIVNLSAYPKYPLFAVLLDRYNDPFGIKLSFQPILMENNFEMSERYTDLVRQLLADDQKRLNCQVVAGNMIALGGPSTRRPSLFSANTLPSEDDLRWNVGSRILLFHEVANRKYQTIIKPQLRYIPQAELLPDAESLLPQATRCLLLGHEAGHVAVRLPKGLEHRMGRFFTTVKEALCDSWGLRGWSQRVGKPINGIDRDFFFGEVSSSVAWALSDMKESSGAIVGEKGEVDPYSLIGAMWINSLLRNNGLSFNRGRYYWPNFERLLVAVYDHFDVMKDLVSVKKINESTIQSKIEDLARDPYDFFPKTT